MSSSGIKPGPQSKPGQGSFPAGPPNSQAILLEKLNRRSTPDSEALASSDDEPENNRHENRPPPAQPPKPVRRASWLNDTSQPPMARQNQRKGSFASSSMSPTTSHPTTPSGDGGVASWGSHPATTGVLGRGHPTSGSFPWGTGIWNTEKKEPPSRLTEVLPSPTSTVPPGGSNNSFFGSDGGLGGLAQTSPATRETPNSQIPFAIPLHPTPKTYRSQSYSVGQLEPETIAASMTSSTLMGTRRAIPHHGLQHRPSRPSMLSEMSNDGSMLGKVNEDDDDDSSGSVPGSQHQDPAKTIELLQRENMLLRQQHYQNSRLRPRASTASAFGLSSSYLQEPVPEESDYAVDEHDELNDGSDAATRRGLLPRRMSEYGVGGPYRAPYSVENRKLENVKKAYWHTSLGFGGLGELSQSRRHSFADVPTRQASISSIGEAVQALEPTAQDFAHAQEFSAAYPESSSYPITNPLPNYFAGAAGSQQAPGQAAYGNHFSSPYAGMPGPGSYTTRPSSPHRSMYGMSQPRHNQSLHIVLFKCSRADVFYIQEGTGLTVRPGDLVIVEADRGTDLGTVAHENVDWQTAKEFKEFYAEEHYKWLMMYSQNAAASQEGAGAGLMAASNGLQGSAVGGMGPPSQHHHIQEPGAGELKPKLIKRLAQQHEVIALRDKEGNEAKAKRICQQKVKEHGLSMEILDAEFQMDWKKLTFYYFADTYINFNSLVTDLFKIYKTRIWMSAINPASFASPPLGLQAPSGVGPGAVGVNRSATSTRRQESQQEPQAAAYSGSNQGGRGMQPSFATSFSADRALAPALNYPAANYPYNGYSSFGNAGRPGAIPYTPGMMQGPDAFSGTLSQGADYTRLARFPSPQSASGPQHDQTISSLGAQGDLLGSFQGLSLNSR
ncbi:uncharacterized protein B0T15DRAFT_237546 [Chaetomium strumarium]|uniref:PSP1 C-terminal domain-containing protein n=1 Tax=Chaetomium strumarium TaxID=1170767 RepID=A0AAJ0GQR4_9PEZI|nr:hypothetical protein B0T15DRAFT_237546 [Chaetomium strumarium]